MGTAAAGVGRRALKLPQRPPPVDAPVDSEAATLDLNQKAAFREELRRQQKANQRAERAEQANQRAMPPPPLQLQQQQDKEQVQPLQSTADEASVATVRNDHGRKPGGRRNSTEFMGQHMEPVQQLKLDGAKKAKIPHFLSAWFNAGHDDIKETTPAAAVVDSSTTSDDVASSTNTNETIISGHEMYKEHHVAAVQAAKRDALGTKPPPVADAEVGKDRTSATAGEAGKPRGNGYRQNINFHEITLGRMIGEGAFGKVHEGKWRNKSVAVKLLICQDLRSDILNEFQSEVEIMSVLRHPNICRLLGACMEPPHRALVVELLQRGSLWGVLRMNRKSIDQEMRSRFIYDTAKGMSYLHHFERPILHRDLKSPNLLVDKNFNIKLSDFGLARVKAHVQTMTGNCGTVQWMAPEVLGNQKYTEKADVFSFGIVIWEIVTGECPYDGMSQIQAALGVLNRNLRPNIPRDCPPFFSRLMKACWNRQPELRPSFPHIVNAFRTYQSSISESRATSSAAASAKAAMAASVAAS
uniref:non-specific serine/threonine protein kinase n=1 Tax=Hyaloperonospora arabidopsidis (strain Emoy2) TaxID=559515 RepID=M4BTV9_HYAAE